MYITINYKLRDLMSVSDNEQDFKIKWINAKIPKEDFFILERCNKFNYPKSFGGSFGIQGGSSCSGGAGSGCGIPYGSA